MARDEQGFPIIPHEVVTGADCCGCLIVQVRGDQADITCNECGAVVRTVRVELASAVMVEMASTVICKMIVRRPFHVLELSHQDRLQPTTVFYLVGGETLAPAPASRPP